jgi:hypothetical protein
LPPDRALCALTVIVISSPIIRSIATAIGWMVNLGSVATAPTTSAAVDLALEHLRKLGTECPKGTGTRASQWFRRNEGAPSPRGAAGSDRDGG